LAGWLLVIDRWLWLLQLQLEFVCAPQFQFGQVGQLASSKLELLSGVALGARSLPLGQVRAAFLRRLTTGRLTLASVPTSRNANELNF